ncbi:MAG: response regulator receiver modulated CheB methylesterase [Labilithrix sp.]|nr:response regulator receiver modulated CheB methylesterase [Labilithrix sp.]
MPKIRVLIVEDSPTVRGRLVEVVSAGPGFEVVGEAADGKRAIELCTALRPDVIMMDMMLPVMTGLAATEYIMAHQPTPILIVSSSSNRGELFKTYDALSAGAVDVLEKPMGDEAEGAWEATLLSTLRVVSRIKVITHLRARFRNTPFPGAASAAGRAAARPRGTRAEVIVIGASTGGPGAIVDVLRSLPPAVTLPVLIVLHIGEKFGSALAEWLDTQSPRRVACATDGMPVSSLAGRVVMAAPDRHLVVRGGHLRLDGGPERFSCRPSVDVLFESVAREYGGAAVACLLTGMGRDGAAGLLEIRRAGGSTIAQDEATSVIFGMPREAALLGAAEQVLPLQEIGAAIGQLVTGTGERSR